MITIDRQPAESYTAFLKRIIHATSNKQLTYSEMGDALLGTANVYSSENLRKAFYVLEKICDNIDGDANITDNDILREIEVQKRELKKERAKFIAEKNEYNKWLREDARDELIVEKIIDAINNTPSVVVPKVVAPVDCEKSWLLILSDEHFGIEFEIRDLFNNVINAYSPEIFEARMWRLFDKLLELIALNKITELNIMNLGDNIQGLLRLNSQLMKLRYGVIDSAVKYAYFLAEWLNRLSFHVRINFQMVTDSNHNQLRLCSAPKNAFVDENMSKVIMVILKERLSVNQNINIIENPTGMAYATLSGYNILGCHGEYRNLSEAINDIQRCYRAPIDYLVAGHIHHSKAEEVGIDSEVIAVRSVIGVDDYGMSLNKASNAGASLICFEENLGKSREYTIKLN